MSIQPITINQCKCERCGHEWQSKIVPKYCAKCNSPFWKFKRGELPRGRRPRK